MNNIGQYGPPAEPDRTLVESAIAEVLQIAEGWGIAPADFIQMLNSGMRISDFLQAMDGSTSSGPAIDCDTAN